MAQETGDSEGESLEKEDPEEWYREGTALNTAGRYPEAIRLFEKVLGARPRDARFLTGLAAAVDHIGFSHALILASQAAAAAPLSPDSWFLRGLALYRRETTPAQKKR